MAILIELHGLFIIHFPIRSREPFEANGCVITKITDAAWETLEKIGLENKSSVEIIPSMVLFKKDYFCGTTPFAIIGYEPGKESSEQIEAVKKCL